MKYIISQLAIALTISILLHVIGLDISRGANISFALIPVSVLFLSNIMAIINFDARIIKNKGVRETFRIKLRSITSNQFLIYFVSILSVLLWMIF